MDKNTFLLIKDSDHSLRDREHVELQNGQTLCFVTESQYRSGMEAIQKVLDSGSMNTGRLLALLDRR